MKISSGQEPYHADPDSHVRPLHRDWWDDLSEAIQKEATYLKHKTNFLLANVLKLMDWIIRTVMLSGAHYFLIKKNKKEILSHRPQWDFYKKLASSHDAGKVFKEPPEISPHEIIKTEKKKIPGGSISQCKMPNKFSPINPYFEESYWQYHKHKDIHFELWQHDDNQARPTYIFMHGYNADDYRINHIIFSAKKVFNDGANIAFLVLPFHKGKFSFSADVWNFFGHGPAYTTEVFANAVSNCRSLITHLIETRIASKIGVSGISLGGFVSSLVVSADERVDNAVLLAPVYNVPESYMEWFPLRGLFKNILSEENISFSEFRHAYALCNALTFKPKIESKKISILTGLFDLIALPKHVRLLGEHWDKCDIHWLEYGHVGMTRPNPFYEHIQIHISKVSFLEHHHRR
jgi:hypothetical protein